jgi:hypothetical protein
MELSRSYILKNDYTNAKKALDHANELYLEQRFTKYSSKIEKELKSLEEKLNIIKPQ